jgi:hypothetical protein
MEAAGEPGGAQWTCQVPAPNQGLQGDAITLQVFCASAQCLFLCSSVCNEASRCASCLLADVTSATPRLDGRTQCLGHVDGKLQYRLEWCFQDRRGVGLLKVEQDNTAVVKARGNGGNRTVKIVSFTQPGVSSKAPGLLRYELDGKRKEMQPGRLFEGFILPTLSVAEGHPAAAAGQAATTTAPAMTPAPAAAEASGAGGEVQAIGPKRKRDEAENIRVAARTAFCAQLRQGAVVTWNPTPQQPVAIDGVQFSQRTVSLLAAHASRLPPFVIPGVICEST